MFAPLSGMSAGVNPDALMDTSTVVPAGEQHKKSPIYVSSLTDTRGFVLWLRMSYPRGPPAPMKGEKLIILAGTADSFRAMVSILRSLDGSKTVSFHTFSHPEDRS
jgi:hypothetical protein